MRDDHVYWSNARTGTIGRANLNGTDVDHAFVSGLDGGPSAVAVSMRHIYWTGPDVIGRAALDGSGINPAFVTGIALPVALTAA